MAEVADRAGQAVGAQQISVADAGLAHEDVGLAVGTAVEDLEQHVRQFHRLDLLGAARHLIDSLSTNAPPKDREIEAAKARAKAARRYGPSPA